jgi:predicted ArsR family transcriptional regulator
MILTELRSILPADELESMMERIGARLAEQAVLPSQEDLEANVASIVGYLNERGYLASWERDGDAFKLHVANCPFEQVALLHSEVCTVDMTMLTRLLGQSPERVTWASQTDRQCTYIIRPAAD